MHHDYYSCNIPNRRQVLTDVQFRDAHHLRVLNYYHSYGFGNGNAHCPDCSRSMDGGRHATTCNKGGEHTSGRRHNAVAFATAMAIREARGLAVSVYDAEVHNFPIAPDVRPYAVQKRDPSKKLHESNIAARPDLILFPEGFKPPVDLFEKEVSNGSTSSYMISGRNRRVSTLFYMRTAAQR